MKKYEVEMQYEFINPQTGAVQSEVRTFQGEFASEDEAMNFMREREEKRYLVINEIGLTVKEI